MRSVFGRRYKINVREYRRGNKKKENPEKMAKQVTQDDGKHNYNTTQCVLDVTTRKETQIM
jgi:hypothetical protein